MSLKSCFYQNSNMFSAVYDAFGFLMGIRIDKRGRVKFLIRDQVFGESI